MQKKFIHKPKEICLLCNKEIDTNKDEWAVIIDLIGKKITGTKFYHRKCLTDLITGKGEVIKKNFEEKLKNFTEKMLGSVGINNTKFGMALQNLSG